MYMTIPTRISLSNTTSMLNIQGNKARSSKVGSSSVEFIIIARVSPEATAPCCLYILPAATGAFISLSQHGPAFIC